MERKIPSQALDVNLAATRDEEAIITQEHVWLISLSEEYWGMHKRTTEFFKEFHHKYSSSDVILKQLDKISVEDNWLYAKNKDADKAFGIIIGIFEQLIKRNLNTEQKERWLRSYARFLSTISKQHDRPDALLERGFSLLITHYPPDNLLSLKNGRFLVRYLSALHQREGFDEKVIEYFKTLLNATGLYWKDTTDFGSWSKKNHLFSPKGKEILQQLKTFIYSLSTQKETITSWDSLNESLFHKDIAEHLRQEIHSFELSLERIYYLTHLMHLPGMAHLQEHLLWDINAQLKNLTSETSPSNIQDLFDNIFALFADMFETSADIVLNCELTLGKNLIPLGDQSLIDDFIDRVVDLGFVGPSEPAYSDDWQLQVNPNHVKNIRVWLRLFEIDPMKMRRLFSGLIVYLRVGGIFISDTDLFQKDISQLLNADISGCFKQVKQLCRIFPIYFSEVGAEGDIRDYSTAIDQLCHRKDRLIHFFRKQIHTESNNLHIDLCRDIILFWLDGNSQRFGKLVPTPVLATISLDSPLYKEVHEEMMRFFDGIDLDPEDFLAQENRLIFKALHSLDKDDDEPRKRIWYLIRLYTLLRDKYSLDTTDILQRLQKQTFLERETITTLEDSLEHDDFEKAINIIFDFMELLNKRVLDPTESTARENIYYKRHIAAGIPSMYGEYREPKFEALGLIFRLEQLVMRLFEKILTEHNVQIITIQSLHNIYDILRLFQRGLILDGMKSPDLESTLVMLKYSLSTASFSIGQYANIFRFMAKNVKELISEYFLRVYERPLRLILPKLIGQTSETIRQDTGQQAGSIGQTTQMHKTSEEFYREILSSGFLIQPFDNFISSIGKSLLDMEDKYDPEVLRSMLSINVNMTMTSFMTPEPHLDNQIFLGAKAYYLKLLYQKGFPIPPGFILTTELFRHLDVIRNYSSMNNDIDQRIFRKVAALERLTKKNFGDAKNLLLLSVRSGTAFSMPGAMNTFLNIGLNDQIVEEWSKDPAYSWSAWDSYRRLLQNWGMAHGIPRDDFDEIMIQYKDDISIEMKANLSAEQMKELTAQYKEILIKNNIIFEQDINEQLKKAIVLVMESWDSDRCLSYRHHLQIAEEWGTAVVIQQMVIGNRDMQSGTGVLFTHNPKISKAGVNLYGDYVLRSQGEDIVGGLVHAKPISANQEDADVEESLEVKMPKIYKRLHELSVKLIEKYGFTHQEIEFTFESSNPEGLHILQIRNQVIQKPKFRPVFVNSTDTMEIIGRGIGIGGGAICGLVCFTLEDIKKFRKEQPKCNCVLIRPDTVPDDIEMIFEADALITARGGATSHAAVTAARLGKVCIVNCRELIVLEDKKCCFNGIDLECGDAISLDGSIGTIYQGKYKTNLQEIKE